MREIPGWAEHPPGPAEHADVVCRRFERGSKSSGRPRAAGSRKPGPCSLEPQRFCDDPIIAMRRPIQNQRRQFLTEVGMGFTGLALSAMLARDGFGDEQSATWRPPDGRPHFAPRAKSVI